MAEINVERFHNLELEELRKKTGHLAQRLQEKYGLTSQWQGDCLMLERSGVDGHIDVGVDKVAIFLCLSGLLSPMKGMVQGEIECMLDKYLQPQE